ncbi:MAG: hypothetical protein KF729_17020 [Sandaracinaceae bacterium]|nr:hypothetical protein [Sandaracinaceae bacterium]
MAARAAALSMLWRELGAFVREPALRVLHVEREDEAQGALLRLCEALEWHADARGPVTIFEDAAGPGGEGWAARVERLRAEHARRAEAAPGALGPFVWTEEHRAHAELARFAAAARAWLDALAPVAPSATLVLAPARVEDPARWHRDLAALFEAPGLSAVRWVIADAGEAAPCARALGASARLHRVVIDPPDVGAWASTMTRAPDGTPELSRVGRAAPRVALPGGGYAAVVPPARPDRVEVPAAPAEAFAKAAMLEAAAAASAGRAADALAAQVEAVDHAQALGAEALIAAQLALGVRALEAGDEGAAVDHLEHAARWACAAEQAPLEGSARLALGAVHEAAGRHPDAAREYGEAGRAAERAGSPVLAAGAWQTAARHAERLGQLAAAAASLGRAIRVAEADAAVAAATDAEGMRRWVARLLDAMREGARGEAP